MQRKLLEQETQEYRSLELSLPRFNQIRIDANRSIEAVANEIISLIPPQWAN
jgi:thymidylate kinase